MTDIEQFRRSLLSPLERRSIGLRMTDAEAEWLAMDDGRLTDAYLSWQAIQRPSEQLFGPLTPPPTPAESYITQAPQPRYAPPPPAMFGPYRVSAGSNGLGVTRSPILGLAFSLISLFWVTVPALCLPLSIAGLVVSVRAMNRIPEGGRGRGIAQWGLALGTAAAAVSGLLLVILAIPGVNGRG